MENKLDKLEFSLLYLDISPFQEKQFMILRNTLLNSRLGKYMKFLNYGSISFDENDTKHQFPKVTYLDSFKRGKTHCMVFDLYYNSNNNGKYDKLIIYTTMTTRDGYYGYVFYNSKEGKSSHRFMLDFLADAVATSLNRDFNLMLNTVIVDWYLNKAQSIEAAKTDNTVHVPNIIDYENMKQEYHNRMLIGFPENVTVEDYWAGKYMN